VKALANPQVNVSAEARVIGIVAVVAALVVFGLLVIGLTTLGAIVAALGFLAVLERLYRLFGFFRRQGKFFVCFTVACIALCAFAAACWVVYLGTPAAHASRALTIRSGGPLRCVAVI